MKPISDEEPYVPTAEEMQRVAANLRGVVDIADVEVTDARAPRL